MKQLFAFLFAIFLFSACQQQNPSLNSDDEKAIYAIGNDMGMRLKTLQFSEKEKKILNMGVYDGASGKKPRVEPKKFLSKAGEMIRNRHNNIKEEEKKEGEKLLEKAAKRENAEKTESGLVYISIKEGSGESPQASDQVKVNYHGTLRNGEVFDTTRQEGKQPAVFRLNGVIKCWQEGVQKMKVGGKSELYCPSKLAYGDRGAPPKIAPGALLKFEIELLEIVKEDNEKATSANEKESSNKSGDDKTENKSQGEKAKDPHNHSRDHKGEKGNKDSHNHGDNKKEEGKNLKAEEKKIKK